MFIPFEEMPPHARIWIYQASRSFTDAEVAEMQTALKQFVEEWTTHGKNLHASAQVLYNRFLVLAADEAAQASSGCSIDSSVRFVRELENNYHVSFFDRTKLAFLKNDKVEVYSLNELKQRIAENEVTTDTLYFDNLVGTYADLKNSWKKAAATSWLAKYF